MDEKIKGFRCYYCILPKKRVMMELKFNRRGKVDLETRMLGTKVIGIKIKR